MTGSPLGLVLFHGAGGDRDHHTFLALQQMLPERVERLNGVKRINFPYRQKGPGRRPPDRMPKLVETVNEAVAQGAAEWGIDPANIVVGGRSMGGRAASVAIAEGLEAAGLIWLSYPLHPSGKPDRLRVDHFGDITCPVLLIQGMKDPFGSPEEFAEHLLGVTGPVTEHWITGNHSPKPALDADIVEMVAEWLDQLPVD